MIADEAQVHGSKPADTPTASAVTACGACGVVADETQVFCEACGTALGAASTLPDDSAPRPADVQGHDGTLLDDVVAAATDMARRAAIVVSDADLTRSPSHCDQCWAPLSADAHCIRCGAVPLLARDHWSDQPARWLAAVCDRGVRHATNEDAVAVAATGLPGGVGALVVCDGVTMAGDSAVAALAAARSGRDALIAGLTPPRLGPVQLHVPGSRAVSARSQELIRRVRSAVVVANEQVVAGAHAGEPDNPPSCTIVAALMESAGASEGLVVVGWVGDSRAYWIPDSGRAIALTSDDSWAGEAIENGTPREQAESGPHAHAITRWLGIDSPDCQAHIVVQALADSGWLLLCTDGLWNYASEAAQLAQVLHELPVVVQAGVGNPPPSAQVAQGLIDWAHSMGGHDNVSVALARVDCAVAERTPVGLARVTASTVADDRA